MSTDPTNDLIHAVREGNVETAKTLIATLGLCSSDEWSNGYDLLCEALRNEHEKMAELLLKSGCSVNPKNNQLSDTPLHLAVSNRYLEIVSKLLDREANINAKNDCNFTPLHCALNVSSKAEYDIVELLLKKVVNIETPDKNDETILYRRADVNARIQCGWTPLHMVANKMSHYSSRLVELLIRHGADIEARNEDGCTPLHVACMQEVTWAAEALLDCGANVEAKDNFGRTALHYAAQYNRVDWVDVELMVTLLLKFNADPNVTCKDSLIPLEYAVFSDLLYKQVLALKSLDLRVKESVFKKFFNNHYEMILEKMKNYVAAIKTLKIGDSNVTYYDFLTCGTNQLAVYARTESIVESLEKALRKHVEWHMLFPHLKIFNRRLKKAEKIQKKQSLLRSSLKSLHVLSGYVLPDPPALEICEYLTIGEMEILIKAVPTVD